MGGVYISKHSSLSEITIFSIYLVVFVLSKFLEMDEPPEEVVGEEPLPGWLRIETEGQKPYYKSPFPRTVIRTAAMLKEFLKKEHASGRMREVNGSEFSFKRRLGLKMKALPALTNLTEVVGSGEEAVGNMNFKSAYQHRTVVELLTRDTGKIVEHRKLLSNMSRQLDEFRPKDPYKSPESFEDLKKKLSTATDLRDIIAILSEDQKVTDALGAMFSDICLAEVSQIDVNSGPLVEFPCSVNENVYCKIAEQGIQSCPQLMSLVINFVVRKGEPILPGHVMKISTLFSSMCHLVNHDLDALVKIRSLAMQMDGLSNLGLNLLSDCALSQCARSLSNHRDLFADIGCAVMDNTASDFPYQSILDNCDIQTEHLTVEVIEKESVDTSHLLTRSKTKAEALALFTKEQLFLNSEQNQAELDHFRYVVAVAAGRVLASKRPDAKKLADHLPFHHQHENSNNKLSPAVTFILKPYPYQETKNPDTIKLMIRIQRQFLQKVGKTMSHDPEFAKKLKLLEDPDAATEEREEAEQCVREVVQKHGEWLGGGDLLTVKMIQEARMLMAGSATAFGRLEFLGPFRLQLLHMKMKKICQDYAMCMKQEINFDDKISLPWLSALTRVKVSNKAKDIKKNDSTFERADQFIAAVQSYYLVNLFDNYMVTNSELLDDVKSTDTAVSFVLGMLDSFHIQLYFDPNMTVPKKHEGEDDMFDYCKEMVERYLLSLVFDICEEEGDAEGLRALRRVMVSYFLAKKPERQDSKYASFTLIDLIVELAASERSRKRMDLYVVINPSGTAGGGLFRDKFEEHCIRSVKDCLRGTHGGLDDIKLEKEIGGLSVLTGMQQHNRSSALRGKLGKEHSKDLVGETVREQLEENVAKYDPFNRDRKIKHSFLDKSKGNPFHGLTEVNLDRFIKRKKQEYNAKY